MHETEIAAGELVEAGENAPVVLDHADHDLDPAALAVERPVGGAAAGTGRMGRDHRQHGVLDQPGEDRVAVIGAIGEHGGGRQALEQGDGLRRIARLAGGQGESQRIAEAVGEGVRLAREATP